MKIDLEEVHALREKIRVVLPSHGEGVLVRNETMSACLGALVEVAFIRLLQETQAVRKAQVTPEEAKVMITKLEGAIGDAISGVVIEYVPDAKVFRGSSPAEGTE